MFHVKRFGLFLPPRPGKAGRGRIMINSYRKSVSREENLGRDKACIVSTSK
jgi:hypothetical protein